MKEDLELKERIEEYESLTLEENEGEKEDDGLVGVNRLGRGVEGSRSEESEAERSGAQERGVQTVKEQDTEAKRNTMDSSRTAQTSMRYELSVRSTAAVTTAYLGDLIEAGELSPSKSYLALDSSKVRRARDKVLAEASKEGATLTKEDSVRNIMFYSRIDATKVRQFDEETGQYYSRVKNQDHYTLTDGEGRFLVHITKPEKKVEDSNVNDEKEDGEESAESCDEDISEEQGKKQKPAEVVARMIYDWLKLHGLTCTLQFLACDSTNSNTGWRAGIIAWLKSSLVCRREQTSQPDLYLAPV